jgi:hypothetical protein
MSYRTVNGKRRVVLLLVVIRGLIAAGGSGRPLAFSTQTPVRKRSKIQSKPINQLSARKVPYDRPDISGCLARHQMTDLAVGVSALRNQQGWKALRHGRQLCLALPPQPSRKGRGSESQARVQPMNPGRAHHDSNTVADEANKRPGRLTKRALFYKIMSPSPLFWRLPLVSVRRFSQSLASSASPRCASQAHSTRLSPRLTEEKRKNKEKRPAKHSSESAHKTHHGPPPPTSHLFHFPHLRGLFPGWTHSPELRLGSRPLRTVLSQLPS